MDDKLNEKGLWDYYFSLIYAFRKNKREMENLPKGYLSKKHVKGKEYCYYQMRVGGTVKSSYLKAEELPDISSQIKRRKKLKDETKELMKAIEKTEKILPEIPPVKIKEGKREV